MAPAGQVFLLRPAAAWRIDGFPHLLLGRARPVEPRTGGAEDSPPEGGRAVLDLGGRDASGRSQRWRRSQTEDAEEALRLLYVAFTRARSQVIAWWARTPHTPRSALQRVLVDNPAALYGFAPLASS